ncbi:MAG: hypothetical protein IPM57_11750 [Oligoflexia bacterium]|nr:hypothetical protein [Oligoflexia bacterium]
MGKWAYFSILFLLTLSACTENKLESFKKIKEGSITLPILVDNTPINLSFTWSQQAINQNNLTTLYTNSSPVTLNYTINPINDTEVKCFVNNTQKTCTKNSISVSEQGISKTYVEVLHVHSNKKITSSEITLKIDSIPPVINFVSVPQTNTTNIASSIRFSANEEISYSKIWHNGVLVNSQLLGFLFTVNAVVGSNKVEIQSFDKAGNPSSQDPLPKLSYTWVVASPPPPTPIVPSQYTQVLPNQAVMVRPNTYDYAPSVMFDDDGKYKAWWCAGVAGDYIGYSESNSSNNFPNIFSQYYWPNRSNGAIGSEASRIYFDGTHVCDPSVIKHRGTYYLYYGAGAFPDEYCMNEDGSIRSGPNQLNNCNTVILDLVGFPKPYSVYATHVGLAKSTDGVHWERMNNGLPIIMTKADPTNALEFGMTYGSWAYPDHPSTPRLKNKKNVYGAGQPSVIVKDNLFYLLYTDTTGIGRRYYDDGTSAGAGLYVIRSPDPMFQQNVEEVRCPGDESDIAGLHRIKPGTCTNPYWKKLNSGEKPSTKYSVIETYSADLTYSDALGLFAIAFRNHPTIMGMLFFDENFKIAGPGLTLGEAPYRDGPGILHRADGHLLPSTHSDNVCSQIPLEVFSAVGSDPQDALNPWLWDLWRWGATLQNSNSSCTANQIAKIYEGSLIASPNRPLAYVINGFKVYFEVGATALTLSQRVYNLNNSVFDQIPLGLEVYAAKNPDGSTKMKVVGAQNTPAAFLDLTKQKPLWPIECMQTLTANETTGQAPIIQTISIQQWVDYQVGGELFCNGVKKFNP